MFTTFNVTQMPTGNIRRALHLKPRRKFIHREHTFGNSTFYTTRLNTPTQNNERVVRRFFSCCNMPIITGTGDIVTRYKYLLTLNTLLHSIGNATPNIALVDPSGRLIHLMDRLVACCKTVGIFTRENTLYAAQNECLFSLIGASAVLYDDIKFIRNYDIIISDIPINSATASVFGRHGIFCSGLPLLPDEFAALTLQNDEIIPALSGLYFRANHKKLGNLRCENLNYNNTSPTDNDKILYV